MIRLTVSAEHYNYFRDYDPGIGRYIESDPIGLLGGLSTFGYVDAKPLHKTDKYGLKGCGSGPFEGVTPNLAFGTCCDSHDDCYDDCKNKPPKQECDKNFCGCVVKKCMGLGNVASCLTYAKSYCEAVTSSSTAQGAFNNSRKNCDKPLACAPGATAGT